LDLRGFMPKTDRTDIPRWLAGLILAGLMAAAWRIESHKPVGASNKAIAAAKRPLIRPSAKSRPTWRDWKQILWRLYQAMTDRRLLAVAAGIVFYGLLALFPAITAFVSLYGLFAKASTIGQHLSLAEGILPAGAFDIVQEQVGRILAKGQGQLSLAFVFGTALALWSANAGMKAMMDALNVIYGVSESRSIVRLNLLSLALTLGAIVMLLLIVAAVVVFPLLMALFGLGPWADSLMPWLRWPILLACVLSGISVLYRFGPSRHGARWRWITPGSLFATLAWLLGSALLSWYLANVANYDATYGSLGAAIGLMMWMWMSSVVVLIGAQINQVLDRWGAQAEKPMQQAGFDGCAAR
jgi:membrane protein